MPKLNLSIIENKSSFKIETDIKLIELCFS